MILVPCGPMSTEFRNRLIGASLSVLAVVVFGTLGYYILGNGRWAIADCLYMTIITLTTVGYGEILSDFHSVDHVRTFTLLLIVMGMGVFLYFASTLTAFIIEGELRRTLASQRMRKKIPKLDNHVIVCGVGSTGTHVIKELMTTKTPMVAVDQVEANLEELAREHGRKFLYVVGDATDDHILQAAGIENAAGMVAALASDKDNLYLVVTAQQLHPAPENFRIVARGSELSVLAKLRRAGAHAVVSPNYIGGMRLASEMIRPTVVKFLDDMLRDDTAVRLEEVHIAPSAHVGDKSLRDLDVRNRVNVSVLAVKPADKEHYIYNPAPEQKLEPGMVLVVLGATKNIDQLRQLVA